MCMFQMHDRCSVWLKRLSWLILLRTMVRILSLSAAAAASGTLLEYFEPTALRTLQRTKNLR